MHIQTHPSVKGLSCGHSVFEAWYKDRDWSASCTYPYQSPPLTGLASRPS